MNKFLQKLAKIFLGLSMAAGVGVAIGVGRKDVSPAIAAETSVSFLKTGITYDDSVVTLSGNASSNSGASYWGMYGGATLTTKTTYTINSNQTITISMRARTYGGVDSTMQVMTFEVLNSAGTSVLKSGTLTPTSSTMSNYSTTLAAINSGTSLSVKFRLKCSSTATNAKFTGMASASFAYTAAAGTTYSVTYNNNGGSGTITDSNSPYAENATVTVKDSTGFTAPSGKEFSKWNTSANGQGTDYAPGATFSITANTILYAQWVNETGTKLTFDVSSNPGGWPTANETTLTDYTYTLSDVDYTFSLKNVKCNSGYLMCTATAVIGLPAIQGKKLTKVVASNSSGCSTSVVVGVSSSSSSFSAVTGGANQTWSTQSSSYTYSLSNTTINTQYYLYITSKNAQILSLVLTYEDVQTYTATFEVDSNCTGYGTLSSSSITYITPGATIGVSGNKVTIGNSSVTATATSQTTQYSYAFSSWSVSNGDTVNSNITITATFARTTRSYDVTFNMQGHGEAPTKQTIAYGGAVTQPSPAPEVTGYTFGGWYKESSCSNAWNFNTDTVAGTTVLYAKWTVNNYQVSFDLNDHGTSATPATQTVSYGGTVTEPSAPTDTQYNFVGWYKEPGCENAWDFTNDTVSGTTVLYASWTIKTFTISLVSGSHGSLSGTTTVNYGTTFSVTLVADHGYGLPQSLTGVTMDGSGDILSQVTYSAGSITGPAVTGDVVINASCVLLAKTYNISTTVSNGGTSSGDTSIEDMGGEATVTVAAGSGYKLPDSISVTGASFTYTKSDKYHASISLSNVSLIDPLEEQVEITVTCVQLISYNISFTNVQHASHSGATTITEDGEATIVITPDIGYYSPESSSVTVTNATKVSWTKATNTLVIRNPEGAVSISYTPDVNTLTGITLSEEEGYYELGDLIEMPTVTAHYSHISDEVITEGNYSVSGSYNPYVVGDYELTISYTYAGASESATYTAHVKAVSLSYTYDLVTSIGDITEGDYLIVYDASVFDGTDAVSDYTTETITNNKIADSVNIAKQSVHIKPLTGDDAGKHSIKISSTNETNANKYIWSSSSGSNGLNFATSEKALTISATEREDGGAWDITDEGGNVLSFNTNNNQNRFRFFKSTTYTSAGYYAVDLYKKTSSGSENLIRITGEYTGDPKYVGNTVSVSDFLIKKQYNTGDTLTTLTAEEKATVTIVSGATLLDEDNIVRLSYTEGGITKTADVPVSATEVTAELQSVTLTQGANVKKNYIYVSGIQWDFTDLNVFIDYDDNTFDQTLSLASLVQSGEATISPAAPSVGTTSFTVSYRYNDEMDISVGTSTVSGISVIDDYVSNISWQGTSGHFSAYAGEKLTAAQVGSWSVIATMASGATVPLSFGDYTLKVGSKVINSLDYTWVSSDDNQKVTITYGKKADGSDFVRDPGNITRICPLINAIDHEEIITPASDEELEGYYLVTNVSDLSAGDSVIITAAEYDYALSTTQNTNNRGAVSITKDENTIEEVGASVQVFTLEAGTVSGTWAFNTGSGYIYAAHNTSNHLKTETNKSANSSFEITISNNGVAAMTAQGSNSHNELKYNSGSTIFSCYASGQQDVAIYKYINDTIHHDAETETTEYANKAAHFEAQYAVVSFAKYMNATMNGENVCSGTQENLADAWTAVASKYAELIANNAKLNSDEKNWANSMLKYATASWASTEEAACVERAMKTYDFCVKNHSGVCNEFLSSVRSVESPRISPLMNIIGENTNTVAIIVIISMVSVTAIGGYFFLRKRKEQ